MSANPKPLPLNPRELADRRGFVTTTESEAFVCGYYAALKDKAVPLADDAELIARLRANAKVCREERGRDLPEASKRELENDAREWDDAANALEQRSAALRAVRELCAQSYEEYSEGKFGMIYADAVERILAAMENAK